MLGLNTLQPDARALDKFPSIETIRARCTLDDATGCWNWNGCIQSNGYGRVEMFGRSMYAHRASFLLSRSRLRLPLDVCHACDNRRCCNPAHLFEGTRADNMRDALAKGRVARGEKLSVFHQGEKSSFAKLTEGDVLAIRAARGTSTKSLAAAFKVSPDNIRRILRRDTWRHI